MFWLLSALDSAVFWLLPAMDKCIYTLIAEGFYHWHDSDTKFHNKKMQ